MNTKRLLIPMCIAALFAWGCGDDDPAEPGGGGGDDAVLWTTPGGDFVALASATIPVGDVGMYRWGSTAQMVGDVQAWLADPDSDYGWLLRGSEMPPDTVSAKRFDSRQNSTAAVRPALVVYHDGSTTPTTIPAVKDNTLIEDDEGDRSNGAGEFLFAGLTAEPSDRIRRGLIAFSAVDSLGSATAIDSVFLQLSMSKTTGHPTSFPFSLHRVTSDWGEGSSIGPRGEGAGGAATSGDATWIYSFYEP